MISEIPIQRAASLQNNGHQATALYPSASVQASWLQPPWRSRDLTHLCSPELTHQDGFPPYSINAVQCVCALSALQFVLT